jgi:hypothetical protein
MKAISTCLVFVMILSSAAVYAGAAPQAGTRQQAQEEKVFEGVLVRIDTNAKMLTVKGPDDKDWLFTYTDATQVMGPDRTIQGLAGKPGAPLKITYRVEQGKNQATRIEVASPQK